MYDECVVGVYEAVDRAREAVHILGRADFPRGQVSLVASNLDSVPDLKHELKFGDDSMWDAVAGAGVGGLAGTLAGTAALTLADLGMLVVAGPLAMGLTGVIVGALVGAMEGWGIHKQQIEHYQRLVKLGKVLVIAHGTPLEVDEAHRVLRQTKYVELHIHARNPDDSPEIAPEQ